MKLLYLFIPIFFLFNCIQKNDSKKYCIETYSICLDIPRQVKICEDENGVFSSRETYLCDDKKEMEVYINYDELYNGRITNTDVVEIKSSLNSKLKNLNAELVEIAETVGSLDVYYKTSSSFSVKHYGIVKGNLLEVTIVLFKADAKSELLAYISKIKSSINKYE